MPESSAPNPTPEVLLRAMDSTAGSWDGHGFFPLGDTELLAFVADAPSEAIVDTAGRIKSFLRSREGRLKAALTRSGMGRERGALLLSDLVTAVGLHLFAEAGGRAYAAAVFVLVRAEAVHLLCVGDCAVWCLYGEPGAEDREVIRHSETTRFAGGSFLSVFRGGEACVDSVLEDANTQSSYLGGRRRPFGPAQVITLPTENLHTVVLVSDGAEEQIGAEACAHLFEKAADAAAVRTAFEQSLGEQTIADDITVLAVPIAGQAEPLMQAAISLGEQLKAARDEVTALRQELADCETRLHQEIVQTTNETVALEIGKTNDARARNLEQIKEEVDRVSRHYSEYYAKYYVQEQSKAAANTNIRPIGYGSISGRGSIGGDRSLGDVVEQLKRLNQRVHKLEDREQPSVVRKGMGQEEPATYNLGSHAIPTPPTPPSVSGYAAPARIDRESESQRGESPSHGHHRPRHRGWRKRWEASIYWCREYLTYIVGAVILIVLIIALIVYLKDEGSSANPGRGPYGKPFPPFRSGAGQPDREPQAERHPEFPEEKKR